MPVSVRNTPIWHPTPTPIDMAQAKKAIAKRGKKSATRMAPNTARKSNTPRSSVQTYQNYIGGEWVSSVSGETFENVNPADTRDIIGRFPLSTRQDVNDAINAASEAFNRWRRTPAPRPAEILFRLGEILIRDKDRCGADMTREMGKVLKETGGDVQEAIDCTYYTAGEGRRLHGFTTGGDAGQVCDVRAATGRFVWPDHAMELPDGHSFVEADSGTDLR